jgi:hypothetical protein
MSAEDLEEWLTVRALVSQAHLSSSAPSQPTDRLSFRRPRLRRARDGQKKTGPGRLSVTIAVVELLKYSRRTLRKTLVCALGIPTLLKLTLSCPIVEKYDEEDISHMRKVSGMQSTDFFCL